MPDHASLTFVYQGLPKMTRVESFIGSKGWFSISLLTAASRAETEDLLVATALLDDGSCLDDEVAFQLFSCDASLGSCFSGPPSTLADEHEVAVNGAIQALNDRNHKYFAEELDKIELWSSDLKNVLDKELLDIDQKISEEMRASALGTSLEERLEHQKTARTLEHRRNEKRKKIFDAQDEIYTKRIPKLRTSRRPFRLRRPLLHYLRFALRLSVSTPSS